MDEATARAMIKDHFDTGTDDFVRSSEIYADAAVLEFPQGKERIRGKANILAFRSAYPARISLDIHRTIGCHDLWVNEYTIDYDGEKRLNVVGIMEFRDGKVVRERIYFGEPWEPPAWRAQWVEPMEEPEASQSSVAQLPDTLSVGIFAVVVGRYRTFTADVGSPSPTRWRWIGSPPGLSYSRMPSPSRIGAMCRSISSISPSSRS
jgi:hypothetical protein